MSRGHKFIFLPKYFTNAHVIFPQQQQISITYFPIVSFEPAVYVMDWISRVWLGQRLSGNTRGAAARRHPLTEAESLGFFFWH